MILRRLLLDIFNRNWMLFNLIVYWGITWVFISIKPALGRSENVLAYSEGGRAQAFYDMFMTAVVVYATGLYYFFIAHTVYPKKYAHGFCFAVLCCGYTLTDFPISIRLTSLAPWQFNDCPSASKATVMNMDKYVMWIHYERLHNHNKAKHNKTVCLFLGIYCICLDHCSLWIKINLFHTESFWDNLRYICIFILWWRVKIPLFYNGKFNPVPTDDQKPGLQQPFYWTGSLIILPA